MDPNRFSIGAQLFQSGQIDVVQIKFHTVFAKFLG